MAALGDAAPPHKRAAEHEVPDAPRADMAGVRKTTRRCRKIEKKPASTVSSTSTSTSDDISKAHRYLHDREVSAIKDWSNTVPAKAPKLTPTPGGEDPIVQAYLQAKMALFQRAPAKRKGSTASSSTASSI